jgi:hypothetical protein
VHTVQFQIYDILENGKHFHRAEVAKDLGNRAVKRQNLEELKGSQTT